MTTDLIFSGLVQLIAAGGGGALVAIGVFKFLGKSWIENQLAKNLEVAKSEISLLAARKMKLHDQEYVVFPEVWSKLNKAFASLGQTVTSFRQIPDLSRMSEEELQTWTERSDLSEDEQAYLMGGENKNKAYGRILDWRSLIEAKRDFIDFHTYLQANRIFLPPEIKARIDQIDALLHEVWVAKKMDWDGHDMEDGKSFLRESYNKYNNQAKPIMAEIETLVQGKLFPESRV